MLGEHWLVHLLPRPSSCFDSEMLPVLHQIKSWARLRMTLRAPRSKPQMLSKPRSSVSASAEPLEVSPHITNLELDPVFCWKIIDIMKITES